MGQFVSTETIIIELLLVVTVVALAVRRFSIPYTVALVVVGLILTLQSPLNIELTPELILGLFVPPLVFEAAFHINFNDLRRNLTGILVLAVPGVILTMFIVGGLLTVGTQLSLVSALVFGALIAATDPVSVVAIFRTLGVPKRLSVLIEAESLFNDGTAIVLFNLILAVALTGRFNLLISLGDFLRVATGGVLTGLLLGWGISYLIARVDDYLIETTLTTILAFGSYLLAERLHFSGVLAVVVAGLINGNLGPKGMSPTTRIVLFNFWEYVAFLANSLIFLLLGLQINIPALIPSWKYVLWAILAVLVARALIVYGLGWIVNRSADPVPKRWLHVLNWGGLRGAITLALVLSLPSNFADRELFRLMAFGVVLFTLLAQSTTMRPLIRKLGIITRNPLNIEYEKRHARLTSLKAALGHLENRHQEGLLSTHAWELLQPEFDNRVKEYGDEVRKVLKSAPGLEAEELDIARREALRAQRSALLGLVRDGVISQDVYDELGIEIDMELGKESPSPVLAQEDPEEMIRKWLQPLERERKQDVLDELSQASSPGFDYFLLVLLSCSIATFGLITNSAAVIIGAMLVAPLMSPILGLSLASVAGEQSMFRKAVIALVEGSLLAVALSTLLGLIAGWLPLDVFKVLPAEILSRTHPSPFDLGIGLAGGAAAAYALAQPRLSAALPGVAIATALMPPLCTTGIGIALGNGSVTFGALLLFLTNLAAISFAGIMVFAAMGFRPRHIENTWHHFPRSLFISASLTLLVTVPLIVLTLQVVRQARLNQEVRQAITTELAGLPDAQLVNVDINTTDSTMQLLVTIRTSRQPDYQQVVNFQSAIATSLQRTISLQLFVVPTTKLDPLVPPTLTPTWALTPSSTNTPSPTSTATTTITSTPTPTFTTTPTPTATPVLAYIANTGGMGVYLFDAPAGAVIGSLPEGAPIYILYRREIINGLTWLEIHSANDLLGWVPAEYVIIRP